MLDWPPLGPLGPFSQLCHLLTVSVCLCMSLCVSVRLCMRVWSEVLTWPEDSTIPPGWGLTLCVSVKGQRQETVDRITFSVRPAAARKLTTAVRNTSLKAVWTFTPDHTRQHQVSGDNSWGVVEEAFSSSVSGVLSCLFLGWNLSLASKDQALFPLTTRLWTSPVYAWSFKDCTVES